MAPDEYVCRTGREDGDTWEFAVAIEYEGPDERDEAYGTLEPLAKGKDHRVDHDEGYVVLMGSASLDEVADLFADVTAS